MRNRDCVKKCLALILSVSMALQPGCIALAEETGQETVQSTEAATEALKAETEEPVTEVPQTEAPQTEAPATEAPETEVPQTEAPQTEAPATEEPVTEAPQTEAPQTEAPQTEAPQTEAPQTEVPATEEPVTEAPQTEAPQTEVPATEEPVTETSQTETQAEETEEPVVQAETQYTFKYQIYTWNEAQNRNTKLGTKQMTSNDAIATIPMPDTSSTPDVTVNGKKYVFKGWRVDRVGENNEIQTNLQFAAGTTVMADVSELGSKYLMIYAVYEEKTESYTYTLKYDGNGSGVTSVPAEQEETTANGVAVFKVTDSKPVRPGYLFQGWAESADAAEVKYAAGDEVRIAVGEENQSKTLYAVWKSAMVGPQEDTEINVYVEYMDNSLEKGYRVDEASRKTVTVTCRNKSEHSKYTSHQVKYNDVVKAADVSSFTVEEGWEIVGITKNPGTNQSVFGLDNTFMQGGVQSPYNSFYLVAKKSYTYKLKYDGNGENVTSVPAEQEETTANGVAVFKVTDSKPVRPGYLFQGWAESADATEVKYVAGDEVRIAVGEENQSKTLYAVWEKEASSITLNEEKLSLEFSSQKKLTAKVVNVKEMTWTSSDNAVATVAADGTVTAVGLGTAVITCADKADENVKATCEVTVVDSTVLKATVNAISGTSTKVIWNKIPSASGYQIYRMETGKEGYKLIKTVSNVTTWRNDGLTAGKTYRYYVQAYRMSAGKKVTIKKSSVVSCVMPKIAVSPSKLTLQYGKDATLKVVKTGVTAVKWVSSDTKIAKVSSNGKITAVGLGTVTITCISRENQSVKASCVVTVKDSTVLRLQALAGKTSNKLSWNKIPSASGYMVYGAPCGKSFKLLKTISATGTGWTQSGLASGKPYRYCVKAYRIVNGKKVVLKTSNEVHSVTAGGKYTNVKSISVNPKSMTLKAGATRKITGKVVLSNSKGILLKHTAELMYATGNSKVATVSKDGVVTAVGKGSCRIYVRAGNGVSTTVTVTVK